VVKAQSFVQGDHAFTADVHGTAIAGVIAARANNSLGIVGVAPGAVLFALKACWQADPASRAAVCDSYTLAQAVDFALREGAQVLNFSLTGPRDPLLSQLLEVAGERGVVVLAAAPSSRAGASDSGFPASHPGVLAVHAAGMLGDGPNDDGSPSPSVVPSVAPAAGAPVQLAAPGLDILSTAPRNGYDFYSGSSLAVAQVTGVVALLLEYRPELTPAEVAKVLRRTARQLPEGAEVGDSPGAEPSLRDATAGGAVPLALIDAGAALEAVGDPP
jgi:subtilisin family serine protease